MSGLTSNKLGFSVHPHSPGFGRLRANRNLLCFVDLKAILLHLIANTVSASHRSGLYDWLKNITNQEVEWLR
jgi:hypothetical protein